MNTRTLSYVTLIAAAMAAPATAAPSEPATPAAQPEKKAAPAEAKGAAPAQQESEDADYTGKIVERMNGGGYTYFLLDNAGKQTWVAVPQTEQGKVGETAT
ncbi:MAG TPA: DNA-binding protein, partial [Verrucomicrobiae bacterium]|nr:DNA-binding protein [Verrucomicrobiae bacterium]